MNEVYKITSGFSKLLKCEEAARKEIGDTG